MVEIGDGAGFGQVGFGVGGLSDELGVRNLDGDEPLQLVVMGEVDEAEAALAQHSLDPVATDLRGGGRSRNARAGFPSRFVYGLVRIVHAGCPSFSWGVIGAGRCNENYTIKCDAVLALMMQFVVELPTAPWLQFRSRIVRFPSSLCRHSFTGIHGSQSGSSM